MSRIYLGVGHGGTDSGAVANGLREADCNLDIALLCRDYLKSAGQTVIISRETDKNVTLYEKSAQANRENVDCVVEIHCNAGGGKGFEVFYQKNVTKSFDLAHAIETSVKEIGQTSRGCKTNATADGKDYFHMLREVKAPSVLVECAFIDNKDDYKWVGTFAKRQAMGIALGKGVLRYLNKAFPKENAPTATKKIKYIVQVGAFNSREQAEIYRRQIEKYGIQAIIKTMEV